MKTEREEEKIMTKSHKVKPIPEGYATVTPAITVERAKDALSFYEKAFGAEPVVVMPMPGSDRVMHAEFRIGDSRIMIGEEWPEMPGGPVAPRSLNNAVTSSLLIYTKDTDKAFERAVSAGCKPAMPPETMFWGDRYAKVVDPFGHQWQLATHVEDVPDDEMQRRAQAAFSNPPK